MAVLDTEVQAAIAASVLCWLATIGRDGAPNVSPKEIFCAVGEDRLAIADIASPNSVANIRANPQVCVSFVDVFRQKGFKLNGTAQLIGRRDPAFEEAAASLLRLAGPAFPVRHAILVTVRKAVRIIAPSYMLRPEMDDAERLAAAHRRYGVQPLPDGA